MSAPTRLLLSLVAFSGSLGVEACSLLSPSDHGATTSPSSAPEKHAVRVDSVGYVTDRAKVATIVLTGTGPLSDSTAEVRSAADDSLAWTCDVTGPTTDPDTYMSNEELVSKFARNADGVLSPHRIEQAVSTIWNLDVIEDVSELMNALRP